MNGGVGDQEKVVDIDDDIVSDEFPEETVVLVDVADDDVSDFSAELDVSQMVAKLEATEGTDIQRKREIHRRLEDVQDQRETERNIDSTFNFNIDEDV